MPKATVETVDHVARLARLSLSETERTLFARQLDQILEYAESIQALDLQEVEPMSHALTTGSFREDEPRECLARDRILESAPDPGNGLFRVPRVIGG
jgi:aspartyl-tRNA(Asn)/glutamyl-tRNA(Gln) amidotransferase subunit C